MHLPKEDIKWFELFFDIIFVVGLSKLITELSSNLGSLTIDGLLYSLVLFLILANVWLRVTMLENKVKVIERYLKKKIENNSYRVAVFVQFVFTLSLIYFYDFDNYDDLIYFTLFYLFLTISSTLLYVLRYIKLIAVIFFVVVTFIFGEQYASYILGLFALYMLYESFYTYKHMRTIANSLFIDSRFRPSIDTEFDEIDQSILAYSDFRRKLYVPHLIERLGIIMIVFLAEYVIVSLTALNYYETFYQFLLYGSLFIGIVILFYYNYFSSIEHIDIKMSYEVNKRVKYRKGKQSVYIIMLYFISISSYAFLVKNFYEDYVTFEVMLIGVIGFVLMSVADMALIKLHNEIKDNKKMSIFVGKIILVFICLISLLTNSALVVIITINLCIIASILLGRKYTTIEYEMH